MKSRIVGFICIGASIALMAAAAHLYLPRLVDYYKSRKLYGQIEKEYTTPPGEGEEPGSPADTGQGRGDGMEVPGDGGSTGNGDSTGSEADSGSGIPKKATDALKQVIEGIDSSLDYRDFACIDVDSEGLSSENGDYMGWIYIPDTGISYPVVLSKDNEDYLHADFHKGYSFGGTIFADCRCKNGVLNHHLVLYGHNMRDGSMFAGINSFKDEEFARKHPVFWVITPKYKLLYEVFAVCSPSPYDRRQYGIDGYDFTTNSQFEEAIGFWIENSVVPFRKNPSGSDYVVSMTTCTGDSSVRCIVHGVLLGAYQE